MGDDLNRRTVSDASAAIGAGTALAGGAWRSGLARDAAYPAETVVHARAHDVAVDFNNVGDLAVMA